MDSPSSIYAFPTAIGYCGGSSCVATSIAMAKEKEKATASVKTRPSSRTHIPFLLDDLDNRKEIKIRPKLSIKKARVAPLISRADERAFSDTAVSFSTNEGFRTKQDRNSTFRLASLESCQGNDVSLQYFPATTTMRQGSEEKQRSRSRAIAIQKSNGLNYEDALDEQTLSTEYDWLTWRMYNRITEHRRRFPIKYDSPVPVSSREVRGQEDDRKDAAPCDRVDATYQQERFFEGEVFDLEL